MFPVLNDPPHVAGGTRTICMILYTFPGLDMYVDHAGLCTRQPQLRSYMVYVIEIMIGPRPAILWIQTKKLDVGSS